MEEIELIPGGEETKAHDQDITIMFDQKIHPGKQPLVIPKNLQNEAVIEFIQKNTQSITKENIAQLKVADTNFLEKWEEYFKNNPNLKDMPQDYKNEIFEEKMGELVENLECISL